MKFNLKNIIAITFYLIIIMVSVFFYEKIEHKDNTLLLFIIGVNISALVILITNFIAEKKVVVKEKIIVKEVEKQTNNTQSEEQSTDTDNVQVQLKIQIEPYNKEQDFTKYIDSQLRKLAKQYQIDQAIFYIKENEIYKPVSTYAYFADELPESVQIGDGLVGQVIKEKQMLSLENIPDGYLVIFSGLGKANPRTLLILPAVKNDEVLAVAELAFLNKINNKTKKELEIAIRQISENVFDVI